MRKGARVRELLRRARRAAWSRVPMPMNVVSLLAEVGSWGERIAAAAVRDRVVEIHRGVGAGLKIEAGPVSLPFALGTYEMPVQRVLADLLRPGAVFYDVGANIGFFTLLGARLVGPQGRVYAFEPARENAERARRNAALNRFDQITVCEKAVSRQSGTDLLLLADHPGGHALAAVGAPPDLRGSAPVEVTSIDDLVFSQGLSPPTVVKVDVEGAEADVVAGMSRTLERFRPAVVYEVDDGDSERFRSKEVELEIFFEKRGYRTRPIAPSYPTGSWHVGHAVAVPVG